MAAGEGEEPRDPPPPSPSLPPRPPRVPRISKLRSYRIRIPLLQAEMFDDRTPRTRFLDILRSRPSTKKLRRLLNPLAFLRRAVRRHDQLSLSVPSPLTVRRRLPIYFLRRIDLPALSSLLLTYLSNPLHLALLLWLLCVAASVLMLALLTLGLLNRAFPTRAERNNWIEINNQVLNGLFTLMSIYQHPTVCHHLFMLCRWRSDDILALRNFYCKNAAYRPREWLHMTVVVALLHVTCFAQYALCAIYWSFPTGRRPEFLDDSLIALGLATPVLAAIYLMYSPLGREYDIDTDDSSTSSSLPTRMNLRDRRVVASDPKWVGGLWGIDDNKTVWLLSFFCTCCVFGWNMERLGFGNMYVHVFTFLLLCLAPFWILGATALNVHNDILADVIGITGMVLCVFGLIYGGFWRIEMRKRFKLPGERFYCLSASLMDYVRWMFCWSCSLAQEVRTGNFYDVEDDSLYMKMVIGEQPGETVIWSPRGQTMCRTPIPVLSPWGPTSSVSSNSSEEECALLIMDEEEAKSLGIYDNMRMSVPPPPSPPLPPLIEISEGESLRGREHHDIPPSN